MEDVDKIIQSTLELYANCTSYSDTGIVNRKGGADKSVRFKTVFKRPNNFRFEWRMYHPHFGASGPEYVSVVWSDGKNHSLFAVNRLQEYENLSRPIAGATGISSASVYQIPTLLLPDLFENRPLWLSSKTASLVQDETYDGHLCYVVNVERKNNSESTAWIDQELFCIRKIVTVMRTSLERAEQMKKEMQEMAKRGDLPADIAIPDFPLKDLVKDLITEYNYSDITFDKRLEPELFERNFPEFTD